MKDSSKPSPIENVGNFIINGRIMRIDGKFKQEFRIGDTNILIGKFPRCAEDVKNLRSLGVTGILNLSTEEEMDDLGVKKADLI